MITLDNVMNRTEIIESYILNGENRKAASLLKEIRGEINCSQYGDAFEKVLLIETAKKLNQDVSGFYCNIQKLSESLFSQNCSDGVSVINYLCKLVKDAAQEAYERAFNKALGFIEENLCDNQLSAGAAAEYAGVSASVLVKLFKEKCHISPGDFISESRVKRSQKLLLEEFSVAKAALSVGFSSTESYIRAFKKFTGFTPGEWKRNKLFL